MNKCERRTQKGKKKSKAERRGVYAWQNLHFHRAAHPQTHAEKYVKKVERTRGETGQEKAVRVENSTEARSCIHRKRVGGGQRHARGREGKCRAGGDRCG